jgi:peptide/nickel transport system ATP-binding protein/oligopeptide transport system ATP-binding protein
MAVAEVGSGPSTSEGPAEEPLLEVRDLVKDFPIKGGSIIRRTVASVQAVRRRVV